MEILPAARASARETDLNVSSTFVIIDRAICWFFKFFFNRYALGNALTEMARSCVRVLPLSILNRSMFGSSDQRSSAASGQVNTCINYTGRQAVIPSF